MPITTVYPALLAVGKNPFNGLGEIGSLNRWQRCKTMLVAVAIFPGTHQDRMSCTR